VSRRQPALDALGPERRGDAVVPPLAGRAAVAVDEADEPPAGEGAEEAEALPGDVPRQDLADPRARRVGPDLLELAPEAQNAVSLDRPDLDAHVDRHVVTSSLPKKELEIT
jgi:hypothetical protein